MTHQSHARPEYGAIIARIGKWFRGADASREADSPRSGVLSYAVEWHALQVGFAVGFASTQADPRVKRYIYHVVGLPIDAETSRREAIRQSRAESWYATSGLLGGAVAGLAVEAAKRSRFVRTADWDAVAPYVDPGTTYDPNSCTNQTGKTDENGTNGSGGA